MQTVFETPVYSARLIHDQKRFSAALRFIHHDLIGRRHMADYTDQHIRMRAAERCLRKATEMRPLLRYWSNHENPITPDRRCEDP